MSFALYINAVGNLEQIAAGDTLNVDDIDVAGTGHMTVGQSLGAADELQLGSSGGTSGTGDVRVLTDLYVDNDLYVTGSSTVTVDETVTGTFNADGNVNLGSGNDTINLGDTGGGDTINVNDTLLMGGNFIRAQGFNEVSPTALSADQNDYDPTNFGTADILRQDLNANDYGITGFAAPGAGDNEKFIVSNINGTFALILYHEDANSTAANRILCPGDAAVTLYPGESAMLVYDETSSRWRVVAVSKEIAVPSLQAAYEGGQSISVSSAFDIISFENSTDTTQILNINATAGAIPFLVQINSGTIFGVNANGSINANPSTNQNFTVTPTGTGKFVVNGEANFNGLTRLGDGTGDQIHLGGGGSDVVYLDNDLSTGNSVRSIGISSNVALANLWLQSVVGGAGTGISLRATGNGTSGSEAIGVYIGGFVNFTPGASDLQTVLEAIDGAIGSGGATLQTAYEAGNTISIDSANGALQYSNSTDATDVLQLSRTFAGAGSALTVSMGASTTDIGVDISNVNGASGTLVSINNATSSALALDVTHNSQTALQVGADFTGYAAGDMFLTGNQTLNLTSVNDNIYIDAQGAELTFDDVGNIGLTLSDASNRSFSGALMSGVTSIVGAFNAITDEIEDVGVEQFVTVNLATGVTTTIGSPLAYSGSGEVKLADADDGTAQRFCGIAREAQTGPASITMWTPGALCTDSGASHTPGDPLFISATAGDLTSTAPTGSGTLVQRVGWALSATTFVLDPGPSVIL